MNEPVPEFPENEPPVPPNPTFPAPAETGALEGGSFLPSYATYPFGWSRKSLRRFISLLLLFAVVLAFLYAVRAILPPFLIAFFLAALLEPSIRHQEQHGHLFRSRTQIILAYYLFAAAVLIVLAIKVFPLASDQFTSISHNLSQYYANIQSSVNTFLVHHEKLLRYFGVKQTNLQSLLNDRSGPAQKAITAFLKGVRDIIQALLDKITWLIIIPVATFFIMRDYPKLRAKFIWFFPESLQEQVDRISREVVDVFSAYLRGLVKICILLSICATLLFAALDVQYALFLGLLAGLFYAVPYIGNIITALSAAVVAFLSPHNVLGILHIHANSFPFALIVGGSFGLLAGVIFDQLVYPRVVGGSVGLHPVLSLFALTAGATLFGIWGMLLATPVAASIQIVFSYLFPRLAQAPPYHLYEDIPPKSAVTVHSLLPPRLMRAFKAAVAQMTGMWKSFRERRQGE
ncbi:predicted permease [Chthonomonas calidirosea]|uniref:Predicted permease n=1 Tax=Chthonomonas calidirosea (strain DSM 23976 / ICMP 18418 / T49) TaxID=1303518 RepID=S0EVC7_CHTCT|nr:AI-2E family transporter [Chthonomonas calidirosea]CCW35730.1 Predicted permease [Chthonomonas calidirosea T49]CEK19410.1 predicted permease [Chthonomonas calidirosea]